MWQQIGKAWQALRRRPWCTGLVAGVVVLAASFAAVDYWAQSQFRGAQQALHQERFAEARACLQRCLRLWWWQTPDVLLLAARLERLNENYPEAERYLAQSQKLRGHAHEATQVEEMLLGAETGQFPAVETALWQRTQHKDPESPQILRTLTKVYLSQLNLFPAWKAVNGWLSLNPDSGEAHAWRGEIALRWGESTQAEKDLRKTLIIAPQRSGTRLLLVQLLLQKYGNPSEILPHIQYLLKEDPQRPDYLVALAQYHSLQADFPAARTILNQVLEANPTHIGALLQQANIAYEAGDFAVAEEWTRKAIAQDSHDFKSRGLLVDCLKRQGSPPKLAQAALEHKKAVAAKADADRLFQLGRQISETAQAKPIPADVWAEFGGLLVRTGKVQEGLQYLNKALALEPQNTTAHGLLAQYYEEQHQFAKAAEHQKLAKPAVPKSKPAAPN
jgi:tetratricopeptide (TPR) repeat protein